MEGAHHSDREAAEHLLQDLLRQVQAGPGPGRLLPYPTRLDRLDQQSQDQVEEEEEEGEEEEDGDAEPTHHRGAQMRF